MRQLCRTLWLILVAVPALVAACGATPTDPAALKNGNRLFRSGQLAEALDAYREGWDPARPDAVLAYNLATTAHHLDRLPEALLWYRRALAANPGDRWLTDNLDSVRSQLGSQPPPPPGLAARLAQHTGRLTAGAAVLAWTALLLALAGRRRWADGLGVTALLVLILGLLPAQVAPRPAVVLTDCGPGGPLAGAEVWAHPQRGAEAEITPSITVLVDDDETRCPAAAVAFVEP